MVIIRMGLSASLIFPQTVWPHCGVLTVREMGWFRLRFAPGGGFWWLLPSNHSVALHVKCGNRNSAVHGQWRMPAPVLSVFCVQLVEEITAGFKIKEQHVVSSRLIGQGILKKTTPAIEPCKYSWSPEVKICISPARNVGWDPGRRVVPAQGHKKRVFRGENWRFACAKRWDAGPCAGPQRMRLQILVVFPAHSHKKNVSRGLPARKVGWDPGWRVVPAQGYVSEAPTCVQVVTCATWYLGFLVWFSGAFFKLAFAPRGLCKRPWFTDSIGTGRRNRCPQCEHVVVLTHSTHAFRSHGRSESSRAARDCVASYNSVTLSSHGRVSYRRYPCLSNLFQHTPLIKPWLIA